MAMLSCTQSGKKLVPRRSIAQAAGRCKCECTKSMTLLAGVSSGCSANIMYSAHYEPGRCWASPSFPEHSLRNMLQFCLPFEP